MKSLSREQWVGVAVGLACAGFGIARRTHYVRDSQRLKTLAASAAAGHRIGALVGRTFLGPAGHVVGLAAGAAVGVLIIAHRERQAQTLDVTPSQKAA